ncbi:MAG: ribonuclease HII [Deltaproteobacteria bacterium]|nr:ribonuclease HII [Deltaproteobacteria bacterium]
MTPNGVSLFAGVDEAGRGPLAGPVVAAAAVFSTPPKSPFIKDSKKLTPAGRANALPHVYAAAVAYAVGIVTHDEIDRINIHKASLLAMEKAVAGLKVRPGLLLIDGKFTIKSDIPQKAIISGDVLSRAIGAASIIAKTTRDGLMDEYHLIYPVYNFIRNKGYPTKEHIEAIRKHGPCPIHRTTFKGVRLEP